MSGQICYFDNNATTRVAPAVVEAMLPFLTEQWGNPSSLYGFGQDLNRPLEQARAKVAALINAELTEIIFTSCGTESINSVLRSAVAIRPGRRHIVATAVEHSATLKCCRFLETQGCSITYLPVNADGALDLALLEHSIRQDTALVSVMSANNETGLLFPVAEIAALCHEKGIPCHTDAVQMAGKLRLNVRALGVDFLSLSAHKLHAPKGIGALYVKSGTKYQPYLMGGGQETGRRGGTENVAGIVGFGRAAELALGNLEIQNTRVRALRDKLERQILSQIPGAVRNGPSEPRLPNSTNIAFDAIEAEGLLLLLDEAGICASSGSACAAGSLDPSHVLTAMGFGAARARGSIRFSLGIDSTEAEVDYVLKVLPGLLRKCNGSGQTT